jgi:hypothetical protein
MFNLFKSKKDTIEVTTETPVSDSQKSFTDIREKWKALAADRKITKEDIAALCIYRSLIKDEGLDGAKGRLYKAFTPVSNPIKLENGTRPYGSLSQAVACIKWSNVITWLDTDEAKVVSEMAQTLFRGPL